MELDDIFSSLPLDQKLGDEQKRPRKEHLPFMCRYKSKPCFNPRAFKRNGAPHNLCEEHRLQANNNQLRFELRRRLGAAHNAPFERPLPATQRQSRVNRLAQVARIASAISREAAARKQAEEQRLGELIDLIESTNEYDAFSGLGEDTASSGSDSDLSIKFPFNPEFSLDCLLGPDYAASETVSMVAGNPRDMIEKDELDSWSQLTVQWSESKFGASVANGCAEALVNEY